MLPYPSSRITRYDAIASLKVQLAATSLDATTLNITQVQGRVLFPAAGMLEMLWGTARSAYQPSGLQLLLANATIVAPIVLQVKGLHLSATLNYVTGEIELRTTTVSSKLHMAVKPGEPRPV